MARKDGDLSLRVIGGVVSLAAGFLARRLITAAWKRSTGKEPPVNPEDPEVALAEALGWAIVMGVGMEVIRLIAVRTTAKRLHRSRIVPD